MRFWAVYVVYNPDKAYLEKSLEAVAPQVDGIVIVDNGGGPQSEDVQKHKALVIRNNGNTGMAAALNNGFREAIRNGAECVITFDQDSIPPSDMVEKYREFFVSHPLAGELGCRYSGSEKFDSSRETDHVITSGAAIPSRVFNAVGDFREDYFIDMVDVEYSWRMRKDGWEVWQLPDIMLQHQLGEGLGGITFMGKKRISFIIHQPWRWYYMVRNTFLVCHEYRNILTGECRKYRLHILRSLTRSILFGENRFKVLGFAARGIWDFLTYGRKAGTKKPLVSVIVPNYNHAAFLEERLDSILKQTYSNLEIIALDDCSTDNSRNILEKYRCRISKIIYNDENSGSAFRQWSKGIEEASGEYIWIAESDDVALPSLVEKLMKAMLKNADCAYSFCRSALIDHDGKALGYHLHQKNLPRCQTRWSGTDFIKRYLSRSNMVVNASAVIFRKSLVRDIDKSYEQYRSCGDWLFWILMAQKGSVAFCPKALNEYRQHGNNVTASMSATGVGNTESALLKQFIKNNGYEMSAVEEWFRRKLRK